MKEFGDTGKRGGYKKGVGVGRGEMRRGKKEDSVNFVQFLPSWLLVLTLNSSSSS